jgi:hypothetical protein
MADDGNECPTYNTIRRHDSDQENIHLQLQATVLELNTQIRLENDRAVISPVKTYVYVLT